MRIFFVALAGLLLAACTPDRVASGPPLVLSGLPEPEQRLARALDAFEQLTLWRDLSGMAAGPVVPTGGVRRWNEDLRVRFEGQASTRERETVLRLLKEAADLARLNVNILDGAGTNENFKIVFFPEYGAPPGFANAGCLARSWYAGGGGIARVELFIRAGIRDFSGCVSHELLHGFGFPAHPHELNSVMSYVRGGINEFTEIDRTALRALYRGRVTPGMYHLPAMAAARQFLAEEMGLVPAGGDSSALARPVMDRALARLRDQAAGPARNAADLAAQLGNAYWFGHYVAVDRAEGVRFWRAAAQKEHADARYRLGLAARDGSGTAQDAAEAARLIGLAAAQNHGNAMLEFGRIVRDGRGRDADPVEAHAWFAVAAGRNVAGAAAERDALAGRMSADQLGAARARAAQLSPPR